MCLTQRGAWNHPRHSEVEISINKRKDNVKRMFVLVNVVVLLCILLSCAALCDSVELKRISSPDSVVDAVLTEESCGATTSFAYKVYLVPKGEALTSKHHPKFVADHVDKLDISWRSNKVLDITFLHARIFDYSNFWKSKDVYDFDYLVEIFMVYQDKDHMLSPEDRGSS